MTDQEDRDKKESTESPEPSDAQPKHEIEPSDDAQVTDAIAGDDVSEVSLSDQGAQVEITPEVSTVVAVEGQPKKKGRGLAMFACLLALAAAAGVGYLYYELVYLKPLATMQGQSAVLRADYQSLRKDITAQIAALEKSTQENLASVRADQAKQLANNEDAVVKSLNKALTAAPPSQREWKLAEAEYLVRIANHRVLMAQDSVGALSLLQAADQIMAELDDFALHQARAFLADEIIALRQVPREDLQGVYLRLEAIKSQLNNLPLPEPAFVKATQAQASDQSAWLVLLEELKKFIRFRPLSGEEALKPLLAPDEIRYLSLNLRLALEQSQLAVLKRQQEVFEQSLLNVRRWLVDHVDTTDSRTLAILASVDELMLIELAQPIPDISKSLNELLAIRRSVQ